MSNTQGKRKTSVKTRVLIVTTLVGLALFVYGLLQISDHESYGWGLVWFITGVVLVSPGAWKLMQSEGNRPAGYQ